MKCVLMVAASCMMGIVCGAPVVSNVHIAREGARDVVVTYDLSEPAIVTVRMMADGVAVPWAKTRYLYGHVNCEVGAGTGRRMLWRAGFAGADVNAVALSAEVTAWDLDDPPPYCAVNLDTGATGARYPLSYYPHADAVPGGVGDDAWKTHALLLRKIPATGSAGFRMGSELNESYRDGKYDFPHTVVLTNAFYIAVYETTEEQWFRVAGTYLNTHDAKWSDHQIRWRKRPVDQVEYSKIRGSVNGLNWPTVREPDADSFVGLLRAKTGRLFDLPTEAQWEYACRAGTTGPLYVDIADYANITAAARAIARFSGNNTEVLMDTMEVGSYLPNAWGLYDMCGNVWEWARDRFHADLRDYGDVQTSPEGPSSGTGVIRGGSFCEDVIPRASDGAAVKCAARYPLAQTARSFNVGFRIAFDVK